jgi:ABC-type lipoprotein export system ATPase subunit
MVLPSDLPCAVTATAVPGAAWAVEITDVCKSFRRGAIATPVLRGVNLQVQCGECVLLVGPSGSGKSTLLSILGCILQPDSGQVALLGNAVRSSDLVALRRGRIGFVFQGLRLVRGLTALDNVCVPAMIRGDDPASSRVHAEDLLREVGLGDCIHVRVDHLSAGQCQRVALARALVNDPDLILADEPTAALDVQAGQQVMQVLRQLIATRGKTAIIVTHDPRIVQESDKIYAIEEGRLERRSRLGAKL